MKDLIAKLEAATEGSRELDADIYEAIGCEVVRARKSRRGLNWCYRGHFPHGWLAIRWEKMNHLTTSIDAALTLVPEGMFWSIDSSGSAYICQLDSGGQRGSVRVGDGESPALALCIAALKARQNDLL